MISPYLLLLTLLLSFTTVSSAWSTESPSSVAVAEPTGQQEFPVDESEEAGSDAPPPPAVNVMPSAKPDKAPSAIVIPHESTSPEEDPLKNYTNMVVLQGLNKITARTSLLEVEVGSDISFGTLQIMARQCWRAPADEAPDNKSLLEIWEQKPGEEKTRLFNGWMLSSSPAVSALEHPVYDITVIECKNKQAAAKTEKTTP